MHAATQAFLFTLLHSVWQAALLGLVVSVFCSTLSSSPLLKRNTILIALVVQFFVSLGTFILLYNGHTGSFTYVLPKLNYPAIFKFIEITALLAYAAIVLFKIIHIAIQWHQLTLLNKSKLEAPTHLRIFTSVSALNMGITQNVSIWLSTHVTTPLTYGFLKPVILFPIGLVNHLTVEEIEALLIHELSHIRAKDFVFNWILMYAEIFYFFNPFITQLCKRAKLERELHCDESVLQQQYPRLFYAETLLKTAQQQQTNSVLAIQATENSSTLTKRILKITAYNQKSKRGNTIQHGFIMRSILALLVVGSFILTGFNNHNTSADITNFKTTSANLLPTETKASPFIEKPVTVYTAPTSLTKLNIPKPKLAPRTTSSARPIEEPMATIESTEHPAILTPGYQIIPATTAIPVEMELKMTEEDSQTGETTTTVITFTYKDGKWTLQPNWQIIEKKKPTDSTDIEQPATVRPFRNIQ